MDSVKKSSTDLYQGKPQIVTQLVNCLWITLFISQARFKEIFLLISIFLWSELSSLNYCLYLRNDRVAFCKRTKENILNRFVVNFGTVLCGIKQRPCLPQGKQELSTNRTSAKLLWYNFVSLNTQANMRLLFSHVSIQNTPREMKPLWSFMHIFYLNAHVRVPESNIVKNVDISVMSPWIN